MKDVLAISAKQTHLLIENNDIYTEEYGEVRDPGRLSEAAGLIAKGSAPHVEQAVQAAYQAFQSWRKAARQERRSLLLQAATALEDSIRTAEVRDLRGRAGMDAEVSTAAELGALVTKEFQRWGEVIRRNNIRAE
jgi:acyl-CoA reductase-like NAD-dependent aldehyde dehydrogenase